MRTMQAAIAETWEVGYMPCGIEHSEHVKTTNASKGCLQKFGADPPQSWNWRDSMFGEGGRRLALLWEWLPCVDWVSPHLHEMLGALGWEETQLMSEVGFFHQCFVCKRYLRGA